MSEPYTGQISAFGFGYAPKYWATCAGQTMPINQYQALFALLGTFFGGNGTTNFQLPDLRGRVPLGTGTYPADGTSYNIGQVGGTESVSLILNNMPMHNHTMNVNATLATTGTCTGGSLSQGFSGSSQNPTALPIYVADSNPSATLNPGSIGQVGGQPHENRMPSLVINFCIALQGIFPSRN